MNNHLVFRDGRYRRKWELKKNSSRLNSRRSLRSVRSSRKSLKSRRWNSSTLSTTSKKSWSRKNNPSSFGSFKVLKKMKKRKSNFPKVVGTKYRKDYKTRSRFGDHTLSHISNNSKTWGNASLWRSGSRKFQNSSFTETLKSRRGMRGNPSSRSRRIKPKSPISRGRPRYLQKTFTKGSGNGENRRNSRLSKTNSRHNRSWMQRSSKSRRNKHLRVSKLSKLDLINIEQN